MTAILHPSVERLANDKQVHISQVQKIDEFMAADKVLWGQATWQFGSRPFENRARYSIMIDGELTAHELTLRVDVSKPDSEFHLMLCHAGTTVDRVDYHNARHAVHALAKRRIKAHLVDGPHHHRWRENRDYFLEPHAPKDLVHCVPMPAHVQKFDHCLRWFCNENRLDFASVDLLGYPPRETLF